MTILATTTIKPNFTWSYSSLHDFETCPRRYNEKKNFPEERSENLIFGDAVHAAMAEALRSGNSLPLAYKSYQHWIDKVNRSAGEILVEDQCRWAIDKNFKSTAWFSKTVWMRTVCDVVKVDLSEPAMALVIDWKTGKSINVDELQLTMMALMTFIQFPTLRRVRADFIWLQEDDKTTQIVERAEIADHWAEIMPRVAKLKAAVEEENFPPKPNRLCKKWCPVKSCEFWGL